jgi:HK97 family phage major capsid protein
MTLNEIRELRGKRAALIKQASEYVGICQEDVSTGKRREMKPEERLHHRSMLDRADEMLREIETAERQMTAEASLSVIHRPVPPRTINGGIYMPRLHGDDSRGNPEAEFELRSYISSGAMPQQAVYNAVRVMDDESRGLSFGSSAHAGYLVPTNTSFYGQVVKAMSAVLDINAAGFRQVTTDDAGDMPIPSVDDLDNELSSMMEFATAEATDITVGIRTLRAHLFSSGFVKVSRKLALTGTVEAIVTDTLGERLGRTLSRVLTVGLGTAGEPQGIVTGSSLGHTATAAAAVTVDDLLELQHSMDAAYRRRGKFFMNDSTLLAIRKLRDSEDRPVFSQSYTVGQPDMLLGSPVVIAPHMANLGAGAKPIVFADPSQFLVRRAGQSFFLQRLEERFADQHAIGFLLYLFCDSLVLDDRGVKHMQMAAS